MGNEVAIGRHNLSETVVFFGVSITTHITQIVRAAIP
jgi:hypothetical protein